MNGGAAQKRRRWLRWALVAAGLVAVLAVVGILATGQDGADEPAATSTTIPPGGSPSVVPAPSGGEAPPVAEVGDVTEELRTAAGGAVWGAAIVSAERTEPGRVAVRTSLVDPGSGAGSPEAQQAVAVCEGTVAWLQGHGIADPYVDVQDAGGTSLVLHGHPDLPAGECTEY
ncbi:hypothetical protein [Geodermatophilus sp. SYSU D00700]